MLFKAEVQAVRCTRLQALDVCYRQGRKCTWISDGRYRLQECQRAFKYQIQVVRYSLQAVLRGYRMSSLVIRRQRKIYVFGVEVQGFLDCYYKLSEVGYRLSDKCTVRQKPHNSSGIKIKPIIMSYLSYWMVDTPLYCENFLLFFFCCFNSCHSVSGTDDIPACFCASPCLLAYLSAFS